MSVLGKVISLGIANGWLPRDGLPLDPGGEVVVDVVCGVRATRGFTIFYLHPWGRYGIKYSPLNRCNQLTKFSKEIINSLRGSSTVFLAEAWGGWPCPHLPTQIVVVGTQNAYSVSPLVIPWSVLLSLREPLVGRGYVVIRHGEPGCEALLVILDRERGGRELYQAIEKAVAGIA